MSLIDKVRKDLHNAKEELRETREIIKHYEQMIADRSAVGWLSCYWFRGKHEHVLIPIMEDMVAKLPDGTEIKVEDHDQVVKLDNPKCIFAFCKTRKDAIHWYLIEYHHFGMADHSCWEFQPKDVEVSEIQKWIVRHTEENVERKKTIRRLQRKLQRLLHPQVILNDIERARMQMQKISERITLLQQELESSTQTRGWLAVFYDDGAQVFAIADILGTQTFNDFCECEWRDDTKTVTFRSLLSHFENEEDVHVVLDGRQEDFCGVYTMKFFSKKDEADQWVR